MVRGFIALVASMFLLAVVSVAVADEFKGKISKTDGDKKTITVENKDNKDGVMFDCKDAKVKLGKKDGTFADLKDQAVTITYDKKDGKNIASEIKAGKAK